MHPIEEHDVPVEETQEIPIRTGALEPTFLLRPVSDLMRTDVDTASATETVAHAANSMNRCKVGSVLVTDGARLIGLLTERDIVNKVVAEGKDPITESIGDHMTGEPETLHREDALAYALNLFAMGEYRHVPVVSEDGVLEGILSINDFHRAVTEHFEQEILTLPPRPVRNRPEQRHGG